MPLMDPLTLLSVPVWQPVSYFADVLTRHCVFPPLSLVKFLFGILGYCSAMIAFPFC